MARKTEEQIDREVLADINGENKSVWQDMKENWQGLTRRQKVGFVAGTIAVLGVLGKTGEMDYQSAQLTRQNNEQIMEHARNAGARSAESLLPQKGGDVITDNEGNQLQIVKDEEGNFVEFRNLETGETSQAEIADSLSFDSPESEEIETYENSEEFTDNAGHKAAKIEREANNPEG